MGPDLTGSNRGDVDYTLQNMVDEGPIKTLHDAASLLDLQETIIHPAEHMWGS